MRSETFRPGIFIRVSLILLTSMASGLLVLAGWYGLLAPLLFILGWQSLLLYRYHTKAQEEIRQFVESVHYRDFTRHFDVQRAPAELQPFRSSFNKINSAFKVISREKETQYLHLQTILEIVDTGILSYASDDGTILWMNDSLRNLLHIPYLKTVHSLEKRHPSLYRQVTGLKPGQHGLFELTRRDQKINLQLSSTAFISEDRQYRLIAFQNVNRAVDETESLAWQKLLSVLTHEIMNSVAPIASLAETIKRALNPDSQGVTADPETQGDLRTGIDAIQRRSEGLLRFAEVYRNMSRINKAEIRPIRVSDLFLHIHQLMFPTLEKSGIELEVVLRDPLAELQADSSLVEQVLINLFLNAIDALKDCEKKKIALSLESGANHHAIINVTDNGPGIDPLHLDRIFVPFFSTKKNGSGIGLSLSKQIMILHGGNIRVQSVPGAGTTVSLCF